MVTYIQVNTGYGEWDKAMYHQKCTCGHEIYLHAFVPSYMGNEDKTTMGLWVSQCTFCGYDKENEKFLCEGFIKA